jgi:malto-oligosyltrehalose trehalohydrolase
MDGAFAVTLTDVNAGDRYAYLLDGEGPFPDPSSRYQPEGVHGPSQIIDPSQFAWSDQGWRGVRLQDALIYELHVGTFTRAGTFAGVMERLPYLADLGITAVELMPVADFPGRWNWGYDGVSLFAPARCYGAPDDLRGLVDTAHRLGLVVVLDVVYNHFGPDGAYLPTFSSSYLSTQHRTPWGAAVNLDGEHSSQVRSFFIENALHWLTEYHFDGLRLDATHGFVDESPCHFVRELTASVRESISDRSVLLFAEDERNLNAIVRPFDQGGWGLDAVWSDDFHHQIRRLSAGDRDGYYQDLSGSTVDLATTLNRGWFYSGQHSDYLGEPRGTDPSGVPLNRMVFCIQNHDQVGNRPFGSRLHDRIDPALFRAAASLAARQDLHPALIPALLDAATRVHRTGGLLEETRQFPSASLVDLPMNGDASRYIRNGPSFLYRWLPYGTAVVLDRLKVLLLPLVALLLPLFRIAPPLYQWRVRSRVYRWYAAVRDIDLAISLEQPDVASLRNRLQALESDVASVSVPLAYTGEQYHLRLHIHLLQEELDRREARASARHATRAIRSASSSLP